jgi:putative FmdB family regulatory protein
MPIYEYVCRACGETFEDIVSTDAPPPALPQMQGPKTEKLLSRCRVAASSGDTGFTATAPKASSGGCAGCSGGNCSTCGG